MVSHDERRVHEAESGRWYGPHKSTLPITSCRPTQSPQYYGSHRGGYNPTERVGRNLTDHGSGWIIEEIRNVSLNLAPYDNIGGSSYIKSPKWLIDKKCTVNIKNYDEMCFVYCALAVSHPQKKDPNRVTNYERFVPELDLTGLKFPIGIDQIPLFEKNNTDYAVTVMSIRTDHDGM